MKLLLVEDNPRLAGIMGKLLTDNGMVVDAVATVEEARAALAVMSYDLVLLDLSLPDGNGGDLLRQLRQGRDATPVLVTTAQDSLAEKIRILDAGADDYLVKPFSLDELLARIRAVLRRPPQTALSVLEAGNIAFHVEAQSLFINDTLIELPRLEQLVLAALLSHPGRLMPRERLEQVVYAASDIVTPNAMEAVISRLRRRLEAHGASVTVSAMRGLGYYLAARRAC